MSLVISGAALSPNPANISTSFYWDKDGETAGFRVRGENSKGGFCCSGGNQWQS